MTSTPRIVDGDFSQYILHAKALVEGRPYVATGYIYTPYTSLVSPPARGGRS